MKLAPRIGSAVFLAVLLLALAAAISFAQPSFPPAAPSELLATAVGATRVDLRWTDNASGASNETRVEIERSVGGAYSFAKIDEVGQDVISYTDQSPSPGTLYYYRVRACNAVGCSGYSNVASAQTGQGMTGPSQAPPGGSGAITPIVDPETPVSGSYAIIGDETPCTEPTDPCERFTLLDGSLFQGPPLKMKVVGGDNLTAGVPGKNSSNLSLGGKYAYLTFEYLAGRSEALRVIDVSDPINSQVVGGMEIDNDIPDCTESGGACEALGTFISGKYLYMIFTGNPTSADKLRIFNASNPSHLAYIGGKELTGLPADKTPFGLFVSGNYAYLTFKTGGTNAFRIVDVSNPASPEVAGGEALNCVPSTKEAWGLHVQGKYAYIAVRPATLTDNDPVKLVIVDISNPALPSCVFNGALQNVPNYSARTIFVSGRYAYLAFNGNGIDAFRIIDVSNPGSPQTDGGWTLIEGMPPANARTVHSVGRYVYVTFAATGKDAVRVIDIVDPTNPKIVGGEELTYRMPTNTEVKSAVIQIGGRYGYITFLNQGGGGVSTEVFRIIDVGGIEGVSYSANSLESGNFHATSDSSIFGNLDIRGGLNVGSHTLFNGGLSILGNLKVVGSLEAGVKNFLIDHPLDPQNKFLRHSGVESPERLDFYDGTADLDGKGETVIKLPDYFEVLNRDFRYQFEPLGAPAPGLYLKEPIKNNRFIIAGGPPFGKISWQVTGIRNDAWAKANPLKVEEEKEKPGYLYPKLYSK